MVDLFWNLSLIGNTSGHSLWQDLFFFPDLGVTVLEAFSTRVHRTFEKFAQGKVFGTFRK